MRLHELEAWFVITTASSIVPAAPLPVWATILSCEAWQVARPAVVEVAPLVVVEPVVAVVEVPDPVPDPVPDLDAVVVVVLEVLAAVVEQAASATAATETTRTTERRRRVIPGRGRRCGAPGRGFTGRSPRA